MRTPEVTVLVSTADVLLTTVIMPKINFSQAKTAIPYALEDQLAEDITHLHFAISRSEEKDQYHVAIVKKSLMKAWLTELNSLSISPDRLLPDVLGLPFKAQCWSLYFDTTHVLVRTGNTTGFAIDTDNFRAVIATYLGTTPLKPKKILFFKNGAAPIIDEAIFPDIDIEIIELLDDEPPFSMGLKAIPNINLLQAEFKSKTYKLSPLQKITRMCAILFTSWILISLMSNITAYFYLSHQQAKVTQHIAKLYYEIFPNATQLVSPKLRIEQQLRNLNQQSTDSGLLFLLAKTMPLLAQAKSIKILQMDYKNQTLTLSLQAESFNPLQKFYDSLVKQGILVKQSNTTRLLRTVNTDFVISL